MESTGGLKRELAFQATRITRLTLAVSKSDSSANYYRQLLGLGAEKPRKGTFRVGQSEIILRPAASGDFFRVGVAGFAASAVARELKSLGIAADVAHNENAVSFRDPDGMRVEIGG